MGEQLATIKAGLVTGGFTALWGWVTDITIVGAFGIVATCATLYFAWCKHLRDQELHEAKLEALRKNPVVAADGANDYD